MTIQERETIESRLAEINNQIRSLGPIMRGSVTLMGKRNKQPYFSVTVKGKTRVIYLGRCRAEIARKYSAHYRKLNQLVDEMTLLYMEILKACPVDTTEMDLKID